MIIAAVLVILGLCGADLPHGQSNSKAVSSPPACQGTSQVVPTPTWSCTSWNITTASSLQTACQPPFERSRPTSSSPSSSSTFRDGNVDSMDLPMWQEKRQSCRLLCLLWSTLGSYVSLTGEPVRDTQWTMAQSRRLEPANRRSEPETENTIETSSWSWQRSTSSTWTTNRTHQQRKRTKSRTREEWQRKGQWKHRQKPSSAPSTTRRTSNRTSLDTTYNSDSLYGNIQSANSSYKGTDTGRSSLAKPHDGLASQLRAADTRTTRSNAKHHHTRTEKQWKTIAQCSHQVVESTVQPPGSCTCQSATTCCLEKLRVGSNQQVGTICHRVHATRCQLAEQHCFDQRDSGHLQAGAHNSEDANHRSWRFHRRISPCRHLHGCRSTGYQTGNTISPDPRGLNHHGFTTSRSSQKDRRCDRSRSGTTSSKATDRCRCSSQRWYERRAWRWRFLIGRCVGLTQIACHWPDLPWPWIPGLGWHHSICYEPDFKTAWQADFDGFCLAFDFGFVDKQRPISGSTSSFKHPSAKTVGFCDEVEVKFYSEPVTASFRIDHGALQAWNSKPWSLKERDDHVDHHPDLVDQVPADKPEGTPAPRAPGLEWVQVAGEHFDVPPLHQQFDWVQQFWPAFSAHAREYQRGAGPVAFIRTWFLHDDRVRQWNHWRELRLVPYYDFWHQDLMQLWHDQVQDPTTLEILVVDPPIPVIPGWEHYIGDLILVQSPQPQNRAILASTFLQMPSHDRRSLMALSVPRQQPRHELIRRVGLMFQSWHSPCHIQRGQRTLHDGIIGHIQGSGLTISIEEQNDALSMMQLPTALDNQHTPSMLSMPAQRQQPPHWESDVFSLWIQHSTISCAATGPTVALHTWFIHHDLQRIGFAPRTWNVVAPMASWERQLRFLWDDHVDPQAELRFVFVQPSPVDAHGHGHGHLILIQGDPQYAAVMISAIYEQWHTPGIAQAVFSSPRHVDGQYLLRLIGAARPCEEVPCTLWLRPAQLAIEDAVELQDGTSFEVDIPRLPQHDTTSLLHLPGQRQLSHPTQTGSAPCSNKLSHPGGTLCGSQVSAFAGRRQRLSPHLHRDPLHHIGLDDESSLVQTLVGTPISVKNEPDPPQWHQNMQDFLGDLHPAPANEESHSDSRGASPTPERSEEPPDDPDPPESPSSSHDFHPPPDDPQRQSVLLLQCGRAPIHAYIAWHDHDVMLQEIANHCLVPIHRVMYLYDLQHRPLDLQTDIYPMIVHMDFDLDPGSYEQLCLVDIERHGHPHEAHYYTAPQVTRTVLRVPHQLVRNTLLRLTKVDTYCASVAQRCIVYFNGDNWNLQDPRLRSVSHGAHFRIVLPPFESCPHADILQAWQAANDGPHDNASSGYSPSLLPSRSSDSFDLNQLLESDEQSTFQLAHGVPLTHSSDAAASAPTASSDQRAPTISPTLSFSLSDDDGDQWIDNLYDGLLSPWICGYSEDHSLFVQTWYLSHSNHLRCDPGRPLRLHGHPRQWRSQLVERWRDLLDLAHPYNIEVVQPLPEQDRHLFAAHLIISQHRVPVALFADSRVEVIVNVQFEHAQQFQQWQLALVMPAWSLADDFFFVLQLLPLCQLRRSQGKLCTIHHGPNVLELGLRDLFHNGDSLMVHIPEGPDAAPDTVALLQTNAAKAPTKALLCRSGDSLDFVDSSSVPGHTLEQFVQHECLMHQPQVLQQLATSLRFEVNGFTEPIRTWLVDFHRLDLTHKMRKVRIPLDSNTWAATLHAGWHDLLGDQSFDIHPVFVHNSSLVGILLLAHAPDSSLRRVVFFTDDQQSCFHPRLVRRNVTDGELCNHARLIGIPSIPHSDLQCQIHLNGSLTLSQCSVLNHADVIIVTDRAVSEPTVQNPTVVMLDQLIPPSPQVLISVGKLDFLLNQVSQNQYQAHFTRLGPAWHPATTQALHYTNDWNGEEVLGCHFYTDGSMTSDSSKATASAVLLLVTTHGFRWGGFLATKCLGSPTSQRAEATAIFLAVTWMIDLKLHGSVARHIPCFFFFDNLTAGYTACGQWQPHYNLDIVNVTRSLVLWSQSFFQCPLGWHHVAGHTDHEWNEAADRICAFAIDNPNVQCDTQSLFSVLTFDNQDPVSIQWLWYHQDALFNHPDAPRIRDHHWIFDVGSPFQDQPQAEALDIVQRQQQDADHSREAICFSFEVATANVLTLGTDAARGSMAFGGRAEALAAQFHEAGLHFIGLQETRLRSSGHREFLGYHTFAGPATSRGIGGVQLWVARKVVASGRSILFEHHHFKILVAQSHRLVVRIATKGIRLLCVVLHAPTTTDYTSLHEWWQQTSQSIPKAYKSWKTLFFIDSNSHVGSAQSPAIGDFGASLENISGECFHQWLLHIEAWLPQTFAECHAGSHYTWTHSTGTQARLDFIAVSNDISAEQVHTWVDTDIDLSTQRIDHFCVRARISLWTFATSFKRKPQPMVVESRPEASPARVPWNVNVHSHAAELQRQVQQRQQYTPPKPYKWHLTEETFALIKAKQFHRKRLHQVLLAHRKGLLRAVFLGWKNPDRQAPSHSRWISLCDFDLAWHTFCAQQLSQLVTREVRAEDQIFYERLALQAGRAAEQGLHQVWKTIRQLLPKQRKKSQNSLRCIGSAVGDQVQHFCDLEAGESSNPFKLLSTCHQHQSATQADAPLVLPLESIPTRLDLERLGSQLTTGKAAGLDNIRPDTVKQWLAEDSHSLSVLFVKMWILGAEPLQWKGGLIHCIGKKHNQGLRGIMIMDILGKLWHSVLRAKLLPMLQSNRQPLQLGGFRGQQTAFLTHYLRSIAVLASKSQLSSAFLFLDIKAAYHSLIREVILQPDSLPPRLREVLHSQGADLDLIQHHIEAPSFLTSLDTATLRAATDAHKHTWMTFAKHDQIYQVHRGCRPGSPIADACFNAIMALALRDLQHYLDRHPILIEASHKLQLPTPVAAWVDDVAIPLTASTPSQLDQVLSDTAAEAKDIFASFGLVLNMQPNKTSAVAAYRGPTAPQHRKERHIEQLNHFPLRDGSSLHIAASYEYLGTSFTPTGFIAEEVKHRLNMAMAAFHQVSRRLLHNRHIAIRVRLQLLDSLVGSVLLHGSGNWPILSAQQYTTLSHRYLAWQRQIIGNGPWHPDCQTDLALQQQWKLVPMAVRLAKGRLLYGFQLMQHAPALLVQAATALDQYTDHNWLHGVRHAIRWLSHSFPDMALDDPLQASATEICDWFHRYRHRGPRSVRQAVYRFLEQEFAAHDITVLHSELKTLMETMGVQFQTAPPEAAVPAAQHFECHWCGALFDTKHRHRVHLWLAHQQISDERKFAQTPECQSCHKHFWSTARLQQHLRLSRAYPNGCYERLTWRLPPGRIPDSEQAPKPLQGFQRLPACHVATAPTLQEAVTLRSQQDAIDTIDAAWRMEEYPAVYDEQAGSATIAAFTAIVQRWAPVHCTDETVPLEQICHYVDSCDIASQQHQASWALCHWVCDTLKRSFFPHLSVEAFQRLYKELWSLIEDLPLGHLFLWRRRVEQAYLGPHAELPDLHGRQDRPREVIWHSLLDQQALLAPLFQGDISHVPQVRTVPLMLWNGRPTMVILHLYSGRRRVGDCHWWIQGLAETKYTRFPLLVISVDTAIHPTLTNMDRGDSFDHIMALATARCIAGCLTGPPCETFSAARHMVLDRPGPRPLRSCHQPWGLPHLTCRETRQHTMGSRLLLHSVSAEVATVLAGGGSIMEHPKEPPLPDRASVWRTQLHQCWVQHLPWAHSHHIEQWKFGSLGVKPTTLRALGLGPAKHFDAVLHRHEDQCAYRPQIPLKGRDEFGQFRTAAAKEYPARLCHALCDGLLEALFERADHDGFSVVEPTTAQVQWIQAALSASNLILHDSTFLPDYQGH